MKHELWPRFLQIIAEDLGLDEVPEEWQPQNKMLAELVDEDGDPIDVEVIDIVTIQFALSKEWEVDLDRLHPWKDHASGKLQHLTLGMLFDMLISELGV